MNNATRYKVQVACEPSQPVMISNDPDLYLRAYEFARTAHAGQTRRDGVTPYVYHVYSVTAKVMSRTSDVVCHAAALLHDVIEDTAVTEAQLREQFPAEVVDLVVALTKREDETYDNFIRRLAAHGPKARLIKFCDIVANLGDDPTDEQILKYASALERIALTNSYSAKS